MTAILTDTTPLRGIPDKPLCNLDAEESILGAILLSPDAISNVKDALRPEAFFFESHRTIYTCMLALHAQDELPDLTQVSTWLEDRQMLEKIGGIAKLVHLV
ncbi:MAG: hypothetical protein LDL41_07485 [Coleofasciculus sp. S288]|nr:hypothetical protein [Coleofasciculus sp. S288]